MEVCVFTDASDKFWGAVATQIPSEDLSLPLEDQRHEPLAFLSGTFTGASQRWPIVEKEAYAVVESCKRLDYLVVRPGGFRLFTDHRNLVYMFNPRGSNSGVAKYQADKLQRWALVMSTFPYTIECLPGDTNVWGDLLSRWAVALNELHRDVVAKSDKLRKQARKRRDEKASVKLANFSVGDFVLVGSVAKQPTKLSLVWRGPEQVTRVVTDYVMETQQLVPPYGVSLHHACRMKMYAEAGREVTEDLLEHIAFGDGGFHVERLDGVRVQDGRYEVLVK
ncbi:hypothetical protein LEN26_019336 [Aphanomyces euteiches]|nr:hypothetical protein LEN26_019336 [Aphanomyces euteiches]